MKKINLSVALATYNEEANIADCLKSVQKLADEIIIADGSSTDSTREICKKYGAKVIKTTNKPNFHINKNIAINACKGDWILQLDADERVTLEMANEIKKLISTDYLGFTDWHASTPYPKTDPKPVAYWLKRQNFFLGRYLRKTGQYPDPVIRLFKKGKARLPAKNVHEQMVADGPVAWLKTDLDHYATPSFSRYITRENRYSTLTAQELMDQGVKINPITFIDYMFIKPIFTFLTIYFRHKGIQDGFPGFVFSLFSGIHHPLSYIKLWELHRQKRRIDINKDWD